MEHERAFQEMLAGQWLRNRFKELLVGAMIESVIFYEQLEKESGTLPLVQISIKEHLSSEMFRLFCEVLAQDCVSEYLGVLCSACGLEKHKKRLFENGISINIISERLTKRQGFSEELTDMALKLTWRVLKKMGLFWGGKRINCGFNRYLIIDSGAELSVEYLGTFAEA